MMLCGEKYGEIGQRILQSDEKRKVGKRALDVGGGQIGWDVWPGRREEGMELQGNLRVSLSMTDVLIIHTVGGGYMLEEVVQVGTLTTFERHLTDKWLGKVWRDVDQMLVNGSQLNMVYWLAWTSWPEESVSILFNSKSMTSCACWYTWQGREA